MATTFAFDVYGTLIDPLQISNLLAEQAGSEAQSLAELWRAKQLEYSFRRGLMGTYVRFPEVTRAALDYACEAIGVSLDDDFKSSLMAHYRTLPAFADTRAALTELQDYDARLHAFSNGTSADVGALLAHAQIDSLLTSVVSVDDVKSFKPDPRVYAHFNKATNSKPAETWLVSSNPFDVIGAGACGWNTAWIRRDPKTPFDSWEITPTVVLNSLSALPDVILPLRQTSKPRRHPWRELSKPYS